MRELFGEDEQLAVRNFERLWRKLSDLARRPVKDFRNKCPGCRRRGNNWTCPDGFDPNGNTVLLLDLANRDAAIGTVHDAFYQPTLCVSRLISKIGHLVGKYRGVPTQ